MKTFRDPVHGDMLLTAAEMRVVDTPEFQRLRGIRQLGTSYLVFPGALHSRFEHSLGTCWLLKHMIAQINQKQERRGLQKVIGSEEAAFLAIAALLHDITHIPFGHTFEDERRILPAHDRSDARLHHFLEHGSLGAVLDELGVQKRLVSFFSRMGRDKSGYGYQMVAGPICADLLDYLKRDAFYCGLNLAYDDRIFKYLDIESGQLCFNLYNDRGFRQDAWSELINLLRFRYHLTERVYFHHAKIASGAMLSRVLEALLEAGGMQIPELYQLRDDSFLYVLEQRIGTIKAYQPLLAAFAARKLYKRVYMIARDPLRPAFPRDDVMARIQQDFHLNQEGARAQLEKRLARHLGVPPSAIIIYAPDSHMRLKEARVKVRVNSGPLVSLADLKHPELEALHSRHKALWKFFLFMDEAYEDRFIKASRFLEREIGLPNQLELYHKGQLTLDF